MDINQAAIARDRAIRTLWVALRNLSTLRATDEMTDEDVELWEMVTRHSAVQDVLRINAQHDSREDG